MRDTALCLPSMLPRNWPGWLAVGALSVLGRLPQRLGLWLVAPLGPLFYRLSKRRRAVAQRNIERCFPGLDQGARDRLVRASFAALARMIAELAWCWAGPLRRIDRISSVEGLEHLLDAEEQGRGVLLLTCHTTCMEIGACILARRAVGSGVYRPLRSAVVEWFQNRGRLRYAEHMISKRDARTAVRLLRRGGVLWYAPDQDFGPEQSLFAPFFGIQTATLLATHRLARLTGCAVVPMFPLYDPQQRRYRVTLLPALEHFPSDDPAADLARVNAIMEQQVRRAPEQYWWVHRRFKTRPPGDAPFYE